MTIRHYGHPFGLEIRVLEERGALAFSKSHVLSYRELADCVVGAGELIKATEDRLVGEVEQAAQREGVTE